jgi:RNAse (barnase) inhibitor barstar
MILTSKLKKVPTWPKGKQLAIHGAAVQTMDDLYDLMEKELMFPDYFGHNLDALFDCLCDLPEEITPLQIVMSDTQEFLAKVKEEERDEVFCLFNDAQETWSDEISPDFFQVVFEDFENSQEFFDELFIKVERI